MVKHLPTMWETWVQSLGQEDPLAKHESVYAQRQMPQLKGESNTMKLDGTHPHGGAKR